MCILSTGGYNVIHSTLCVDNRYSLHRDVPMIQREHFAVLLTEHILSAWAMDGHAEIRNRSGCYHLQTGDYHLVVYGSKSLKQIHDVEFHEYETHRDLWKPGIKGLEGIWAIVIHESAHALQTEMGERSHFSVHNYEWRKRVIQMKEEFPYKRMLRWYLLGEYV